jgi:hypothetical protein
MELTGILFAVLGFISAALGTLRILDVPSQPILSAKLTWEFWMAAAGILFLAAIVFMLGRKPGGSED